MGFFSFFFFGSGNSIILKLSFDFRYKREVSDTLIIVLVFFSGSKINVGEGD